MGRHFNKQPRQEFFAPKNDRIRAKEVRVVHDNGSEILPLQQALTMARSQELDLVLISPKANPPVCKIMEYGKYIYQLKQQKKERDKKNRANVVETKEIQFKPQIGIGDLNVKRKKMQEIIDDGDKVKVVMKLRGREMGMKSQLVPKIKEFCDILQGVVYESQPQVFGNKVIAVIKKNT